MKLLNYKQGNDIRVGIKTEQGIIDSANIFESPITMEEIILRGKDGLLEIKRAIQNYSGSYVDESKMTYAPVISNPEKIICVGLNYVNHAEETDIPIPDSPVLFNKFNNALAAHQEEIILAKDAERIDYEAELVIVIGKTTKNVKEENALDHVFGYTIGNDLSDRELQFRTGQWLLGKSCDQFAPVGPYLITEDEIDNINNLEIECKVNGVLRQSANTKDMIFNCSTIVSYVSEYMTLQPGDMIFTGTPAGVIMGYQEEKQVWLKSGDEITVSIQNIGMLTNILK